MLESVLAIVFIAVIATRLATCALALVSNTLYDVTLARKEKQRMRHPESRRYRKRPLISIVIPAYNEEAVIERCLMSVLKNNYHKYEIIVADDGSTDMTKETVENFIVAHPKKNIRLVSGRKNLGRSDAIKAGLGSDARGELVMTLDADSVLAPDALKRISQHFVDPSVQALTPNVKVMRYPSLVSLVQEFDQLLTSHSRKLQTITKTGYRLGTGATFRRELVEKQVDQDNRHGRIDYANDVVVFTEPVLTYHELLAQRFRWQRENTQAVLVDTHTPRTNKFVSWLRLAFGILGQLVLLSEPVALGYVLYLAVAFRNPVLLGVSWLVASGTLALLVLSDATLSFWSKVRLLLLTPIYYPVSYYLIVVRILASLKTVWQLKYPLGRRALPGAWQPAKRITEI